MTGHIHSSKTAQSAHEFILTLNNPTEFSSQVLSGVCFKAAGETKLIYTFKNTCMKSIALVTWIQVGFLTL